MLILHAQSNQKCVTFWFISVKRVKLSKRKTKPTASDGESPAASEDSHEDESNDENESSDDDSKQVEAGAGWADAMAKILGKETPEEESEVVLSKSKEYAKKKAEETKHQLEQRKEVGHLENKR